MCRQQCIDTDIYTLVRNRLYAIQQLKMIRSKLVLRTSTFSKGKKRRLNRIDNERLEGYDHLQAIVLQCL